jgi:glutathione transport system permease protein
MCCTPPLTPLSGTSKDAIVKLASSGDFKRHAGLKPDQVRTPWHEFWRRFRRQPVAMTAGLFVLILIVLAIVAPWIAPFDAENYFDYDRLNDGPSPLHWFGVDSLGAISLAACWWGRRFRWPPGCWRY